MNRVLPLALIVVTAGFTGCLGLFGGDEATAPTGNQGRDLLGNGTLDDLAGRVHAVPRNYTFALQQLLPPTVQFFNWTIGPEANAGLEDRNDRGGNQFNTILLTTDVSKFIPPGQPTEMRLTAYAAPQPGSSAGIDLYVDVPGLKTSFNGGNGDEFNWKWYVERLVVNTIGVAGQKHDIGIQVANGKIVQPLQVTLRAEFAYERDVLTPFHPWAFQVPKEATGILLESAKAGGLESVVSRFVVIGPNDDLVQYVEYNDKAIPTESVYVPASAGPGEYIFYAFDMTGGFLRLNADVGVPDRAVRPLPLDVKEEVVAGGPAPGTIRRDWGRGTTAEGGGLVTPQQGGGAAAGAVATFPLRIVPFVTGSGPTLGTQVTVATSKGIVAEYTRMARADTDMGHVGYTSEHWNTLFVPANLAKGDLAVTFTNNSPTLSAGYTLVTYKRV